MSVAVRYSQYMYMFSKCFSFFHSFFPTTPFLPEPFLFSITRMPVVLYLLARESIWLNDFCSVSFCCVLYISVNLPFRSLLGSDWWMYVLYLCWWLAGMIWNLWCYVICLLCSCLCFSCHGFVYLYVWPIISYCMVTSFYYLPFFLISLLFSFFLHPLFSFPPILTSLSTYFSLSPSHSPFFNTFIFSLLVFLFPLHFHLCSSSCLSSCFSSVLFFFSSVLLLLSSVFLILSLSGFLFHYHVVCLFLLFTIFLLLRPLLHCVLPPPPHSWISGMTRWVVWTARFASCRGTSNSCMKTATSKNRR